MDSPRRFKGRPSPFLIDEFGPGDLIARWRFLTAAIFCYLRLAAFFLVLAVLGLAFAEVFGDCARFSVLGGLALARILLTNFEAAPTLAAGLKVDLGAGLVT